MGMSTLIGKKAYKHIEPNLEGPEGEGISLWAGKKR